MTKRLSLGLAAPALAVLVASCGSSGDATRTDVPPLFFGTTTTTPFNGGAFAASGAETVADLEGERLRVKLVRAERDFPGDEIRFVVTDEELQLTDAGVIDDRTGEPPQGTLTIDGVPYTFVADSDAVSSPSLETLPGGQTLYLWAPNGAEASGSFGVYTDAADITDDGDVDTEGYFVVGWETSPGDIEVRSGSADYVGVINGYGFLLEDGAITDPEAFLRGDIAFAVDFSRSRVRGSFSGQIDGRLDYSARIAGADIEGNGFAADVAMDCTGCSGGGELGAVFYGNGGTEITGVGAMDATVSGERFIGAAGFTTSEVIE